MDQNATIQPPPGFMGYGVSLLFGGRETRPDSRGVGEAFDLAAPGVVFPVQRHTTEVVWVEAPGAPVTHLTHLTAPADPAAPAAPADPADGVLTGLPGIVLAIRTADCVPVLLHDPRRGLIGAVHAGWRGTAGRILPHAIDLLVEQGGADPADLRIAIGPAIGNCCYEVGAEVREKLGLPVVPGRAHVDLPGLNRLQAMARGVLPGHIWQAGLCTHCEAGRFFSYRREGGAAGRQVSAIVRHPHGTSSPPS